MSSLSLSPQALAGACSRNPRRTVAVWAAAVVLAIVAIAALLSGSLSSQGSPTNMPQSQRALDLERSAFPSSTGSERKL